MLILIVPAHPALWQLDRMPQSMSNLGRISRRYPKLGVQLIKRLVKTIAAQKCVQSPDIQSCIDNDCSAYADLCELATLRPDIAGELCRQCEIELAKFGTQLANSEGEHLKFEIRTLTERVWL